MGTRVVRGLIGIANVYFVRRLCPLACCVACWFLCERDGLTEGGKVCLTVEIDSLCLLVMSSQDVLGPRGPVA